MSFLLPPSALRGLSSRVLRQAFRPATQCVRQASTLAAATTPSHRQIEPATFEPSKENPWWRSLIDDAMGNVKPEEPVYEGKKIRIYPTVGKLPVKEVMKLLAEKETAKMDPTGWRTRIFSRTNAEGAKVGDILQVRRKNGEPFAGVCIDIRRRGVDTAFLLRNQLTRIGIEMWFKIYNPAIEGVDIVQKRPKRARRAKLYYMRKSEHDLGSVQSQVDQYMKTRIKPRGSGSSAGKSKYTGANFREKFANRKKK